MTAPPLFDPHGSPNASHPLVVEIVSAHPDCAAARDRVTVVQDTVTAKREVAAARDTTAARTVVSEVLDEIYLTGQVPADLEQRALAATPELVDQAVGRVIGAVFDNVKNAAFNSVADHADELLESLRPHLDQVIADVRSDGKVTPDRLTRWHAVWDAAAVIVGHLNPIGTVVDAPGVVTGKQEIADLGWARNCELYNSGFMETFGATVELPTDPARFLAWAVNEPDLELTVATVAEMSAKRDDMAYRTSPEGRTAAAQAHARAVAAAGAAL